MEAPRLRRIKLFSLMCVAAIGLWLFFHNARSVAQIGGSAVWRDIEASTLLANAGGSRIIKPRRYRTLALDTVGLRALLARAPMEFTSAARGAWTGRSPGLVNGAGDMNMVEVDLAALAGQTAIFRWRLRTDDLTADEALGWWVDDIQFTNLLVSPECNTPP
jgi:hypothetical protein